MTLLEICHTLVNMRGESGAEKPVLEWIAHFLQPYGFTSRWQEYGPGKFNLYLKRGFSPFLWATHVDVNYAGRKAVCTFRNGFLFGPGVLDTRGQIAALLYALSQSSAPAEVVFFSEEETSGAGSWHFVPPHPFEGAIVLEPTNFTLCTAFAGDVETRIEVHGLGGHGAYPHAGTNALCLAEGVVHASREMVKKFTGHPLFVPPPTLMWGKIEGGESNYLIPESCVIECAFPFVPPHSLEEVKGEVFRFIERYPVTVRVEDENPAWEIDRRREIVERLKYAVERVTEKEVIYAGMPSWTDATYLFLRGIESVVFGAGDLALAHSQREGVSLAELELLAGIFLSFLR